MFCHQCGAKNAENSKFCIKCGTKLQVMNDTTHSSSYKVISQESASPVMISDLKTNQKELDSKDYFSDSGEDSDSKKKNGIRKLIAGVVLAVAVVALVYGVVNIFKDSNPKRVSRDWSSLPIVYIKSSDIMVKRNGNKEPYVLTSGSNYMSGNIKFTEDGKIMFFADDPSSREYRLYYRKVDEETPKGKDSDSIGTRIASGVTEFKIQKDGKFILYTRGDRLYYTDLKKDEWLIARDVENFEISNDEKKVVFRNSDGDLYVCGLGKDDEPEKIESEVSRVVGSLRKYEELYYIKDSSLYRKEYGKERERLARDVVSAKMIDEQLYAVKEDETNEFPEFALYTLYKIENGEEIKIADRLERSTFFGSNYNRGENISYSSAAAFLRIPEDSDYPLDDDGIRELYIISQNYTSFKAMDINMTETGYYKFSPDGRYFFIIEEMDDTNNTGELYRYTVGPDSLKDKTKICDEVSQFFAYSEDAVTMQYTDDETIMGFYTDEKFYIISEEAGSRYQYFRDSLYYFDDYSNKNGTGTLMKFKNGKTQKIDTDVYDIFVRSEDDIVYIKDYSTRRDYGDLYHKKGNSKPELVDTDVSFIIKVYN